MKTILAKILFTSMLLSAAVPSILFSAEERRLQLIVVKRRAGGFEITPLLDTVESGDVEKVGRLLENKADVNSGENIKPLMMAAARDNTEMVRLLVQFKADVNSQSKNGATPLMFLVPQGSLETVKILVKAKADPHIKDNCDFTALQMAVQISESSKKLAILALLGAGKVDFNSEDGTVAPLTNAGLSDDLKVVKPSIQNNDDNIDDAISRNNIGALILAVSNGHENKVKRLLGNGAADISYKNGLPLKLAYLKGNREIITMLLEHMTDVRSGTWEKSDTE